MGKKLWFGLLLPMACKTAWEAIRYRSADVNWDKLVWDAAIMPEHAFFLWRAIQNRLSTCDGLAKWGWQGDLLCVFCRSITPALYLWLNNITRVNNLLTDSLLLIKARMSSKY